MTISSTTRVAGPFIGTGTAATFPFEFKAFSEQDIFAATRTTPAVSAIDPPGEES